MWSSSMCIWRNVEVFGLGPRKMWNAGFFLCNVHYEGKIIMAEPWNFHMVHISAHQVVALYASLTCLFGVCVLINSFVVEYHILQKKFVKTDSCHYILNEHCLQPDWRVANTCSAWLKGAVSVDSDYKVLLKKKSIYVSF